MLADWLELPGAAARLRWLSALSGVDLIRLGTTAEADEVTDTAVAQPLIVALGLLAADQLDLTGVGVTAGHSVGELTAAGVAGALTPEAAVAFAAIRGREMAAACANAPTRMSAVLGGDPEEVVARINGLGLTAANRNGGGQIVAAGLVDDLAKLAAEPPAGARVVPLSVAGAFHTDHMAPAEEALQSIADGVTAADPRLRLLSNADGAAVSSGREVVARLVRQVTSPVRWDLCQATLRELGVTTIIELPPAGTLVGIAKRELGRDLTLLAVKSPADLPAAQDLIAQARDAEKGSAR
jgi:[acyl-carrier-protein] S-malonyltransferase